MPKPDGQLYGKNPRTVQYNVPTGINNAAPIDAIEIVSALLKHHPDNQDIIWIRAINDSDYYPLEYGESLSMQGDILSNYIVYSDTASQVICIIASE